MKEKWQKTFWKIYFGQAISLITSSIVQFIIIWYITDKTESALLLSIGSIIAFLPQGILSLFVGSFIDKHSRKKIMIISDAAIAVVSLLLVIVSLFIELPIWLLFVALGLRSIGSAFHGPAMQASIPLIVPQDKLLKYSGYSQAIQSISFIAGPAIAAMLYSFMKLGTIISLDIVGATAAILTLALVEIPNVKTEGNEVNFIKDTKEGIKVILDNKIIKGLFISSIIFMIIFMPVNSLFPLMTKTYFKGDAMDAGIIEMCFSVGMLIGSIALSSLPIFKNKKNNVFISVFMVGFTLFISGVLPTNAFFIYMVMCALMGFVAPIFNGTSSTIFAEQIKPEFLGRVYANFSSVTILATPIGLLLSGLFADKIGINVWFAFSGILVMVLAVWTVFTKYFKKLK